MPAIVQLYVPGTAALFVVNVSVLVLVPDIDDGLNAAVNPAYFVYAVRATLPLKPPVLVRLIVLVPVPPWLTFTLEGDADRLKSGANGLLSISMPLALGPPVTLV